METFEGYIARDEKEKLGDSLSLYRDVPPERDAADFGGYWENRSDFITLPKEMFPDQKWEDEPRKVKVTIELID